MSEPRPFRWGDLPGLILGTACMLGLIIGIVHVTGAQILHVLFG